MEAILTPGHSDGHVVYRLPEERLILTGDLVLPTVHAGILSSGASGTNPVAAYFDSLAR